MNRHRRKSTATAVSAGAIGTFLSLVNVVVGFGFQAALAATLGVGPLADVFQLAWTIVTFAAVVQFTMVTSLLVPRLQAVAEGISSVGRSRLPVYLGVVATAVQAIAAVTVTAGDLGALLLASAPAHLFVGATAVPQAVAYISRRFWVAGAGPVANGIALLLVTVIGLGRLNALLLGVAVTLGYVAQWAVTAFGVRDLAAEADRAVVLSTRLFLGVLAFTLVSKFQPVLERVLSYQLAAGSTAALGYGQKIAQGLILFATFGIATASTASLARHREANDISATADLMARITLVTLVFSSVVGALTLSAAYPAVVVLFERGAFTTRDSHFVATVVVAQIPWVWAGALTGVLTSFLYIDRRYAQVLLASLAGLVVTLVCGVVLKSFVPDIAVAIASSAGSIASLLVVVAIVRRTDVWQQYWHFIAMRRWLVIASIAMIAGAILIEMMLRLAIGEPNFIERVLATLLTALLVACLLVAHSVPRAELREVASAQI